jgi:acetyltransferase
MESIAGDARAFIRLLKRTSKEKPVIVFKTGRTAAGAKAALSHTGAVAKSSDAIFDVAIKQTGAIRAQSLDEFFDLAKIFEYLPSPRKNRIAVSTLPGGEGVIAADICELNGFTMAQLSPETHSRLRSIFPPWDIPVNPFDMGVSVQFNNIVDVHTVLLDALADDSNVDCLAVQIVTVLTEYVLDLDWVGRLFCDVIKKGKPVVTWAADMSGRSTRIIQQLESNRIPVYPSAERAIKALFALYRYHNTRQELTKY